MKIKKHIPNFITSLNLLTGSVGVYFAFSGNYTVAFFAVLIAGLFDFLDGLTARMLKAYSPMGKELDSLADVISFGLLPATVVFSMLESSTYPDWTKYIGLLIVVFSALRLAKFNIDENQRFFHRLVHSRQCHFLDGHGILLCTLADRYAVAYHYTYHFFQWVTSFQISHVCPQI